MSDQVADVMREMTALTDVIANLNLYEVEVMEPKSENLTIGEVK